MTLKVLSLFSGIGGWDLGLERTGGFETVRFCEIDPHARAVLEEHWPGAPCHDDVETMPFEEGEADVVTASFPCQDISIAGPGAGLAGSRSGLFWHVVRALRLVRPDYVGLENVAALLDRGMGTVLGSLAAERYDAEWDCVQAYQVGLPHARSRIVVTAHPHGEGELQPGWGIGNERGWIHDRFQEGSWPLPIDEGDGPIDGVSQRLLGNCFVPQIPEIIGRAILAAGVRALAEGRGA